MHSEKNKIFSDGKFILRAFSAWLISTLILTPAAALILQKTAAGSAEAGYTSSALSFLCALAAGIWALRGENGKIYKALISAASLCVLLITAGFMFGKKGISPDSVLSIVTFSFSGCIAAALLSSGAAGTGKKVKIHKMG